MSVRGGVLEEEGGWRGLEWWMGGHGWERWRVRIASCSRGLCVRVLIFHPV